MAIDVWPRPFPSICPFVFLSSCTLCWSLCVSVPVLPGSCTLAAHQFIIVYPCFPATYCPIILSVTVVYIYMSRHIIRYLFSLCPGPYLSRPPACLLTNLPARTNHATLHCSSISSINTFITFILPPKSVLRLSLHCTTS